MTINYISEAYKNTIKHQNKMKDEVYKIVTSNKFIIDTWNTENLINDYMTIEEIAKYIVNRPYNLLQYFYFYHEKEINYSALSIDEILYDLRNRFILANNNNAINNYNELVKTIEFEIESLKNFELTK